MASLRAGVIAFVVGLISMLVLTGVSVAAEWRIERMSGDVRIFHENVTWVSLSREREIKPGDSIWTGHNGRVMLTSEGNRVLLKPRSLVKVPQQDLPRNSTVLFQSMGTVEADVDKRERQHFSIQSPYLAAVVKGTKFSIEIKDGKTRLDVREGLVEATDMETGQVVAVAAGQHVSKTNGTTSGLSGNAPGANSAASDGAAAPHSPAGSGDSGNSGASSGGADDVSFTNHGDNGRGKKLGHFK